MTLYGFDVLPFPILNQSIVLYPVLTVAPCPAYSILRRQIRWSSIPNSGNSDRLYFWGAPKSLQMVIAVIKLKDAYSLEEKL